LVTLGYQYAAPLGLRITRINASAPPAFALPPAFTSPSGLHRTFRGNASGILA